MEHNKLDLSAVVKAHVRLEGESNRDWTLTLKDGATHKYYSIEGSAQYEGDDERVHEHDQELSDYLDKLSILQPTIRGRDPSQMVMEYDVEVMKGLLTNVRYQRVKPDGSVDETWVLARDCTFSVIYLDPIISVNR